MCATSRKTAPGWVERPTFGGALYSTWGELTLSDDDDELVLETGELMNLRIKAEREDGQCEFSLKVSWKDPRDSAPKKKTPSISS